MSRPNSSSNRPNHIPLPSPSFANHANSPTASPQPQPLASPTSPRSSFLPSFMRTRSRAATITNRLGNGAGSPTQEVVNPLSGVTSRNGNGNGTGGPGRSDGGGVTRSVSTPQTTSSVAPIFAPQLDPIAAAPANPTSAVPSTPTAVSTDSRTFRIRLVPQLDATRSINIDPVIRDVFPIIVQPGISPSVAAASVTSTSAPNRPMINGKLPALLLKVGRYTDKGHLPVPHTAVPPTVGFGAGGTLAAPGSSFGIAGGAAVGAGAGGVVDEFGASAAAGGSRAPPATRAVVGGGGDTTSNRVAFKSKVVSRAHCEIWCEPGGKFFIRDTASSSGTFLNHIRLSSPNVESRPQQLSDGDTLQLGVDFQGSQEEIYRCVKMRVEVGREWQRGANDTNALKQLKALGGGAPSSPDIKPKTDQGTPGKKAKASVTDCCICLFSVTVCQSLFIAPCSHVFHYKCIRPLLLKHHPGFSCPLCRTFANLEEDVETEDAWEIASRRASVISRRPSNHSIRLPAAESPSSRTSGPSGQPSTGVVVGEATRSVVDLLVDNGSGRTSEDTGNSTPQAGRSVQGVSESSSAPVPSDDLQPTPSGLEPPEAMNLDPTPELTSTTTPSQPISIALPILGGWVPGTTTGTPFDDAQTPMNEMFLSTLAGTGMLQRLEAADEGGQRIEEDVEAEAEGDDLGEGTSTGSEGLEHTSNNVVGGVKTRTEAGREEGDEDGDQRMRESSANAARGDGARDDVEMMFT